MKTLLYILLLTPILIAFGCKEAPNGPVTNNYYYSSDSLSDPNIKPKVIFTNPANGAVGPFITDDSNTYPNSAQIIIQFNKLMNVYYNDNSIRLTVNNTSHNLTFVPPYLNNILSFSTSTKYLAKKVYTVTVDTTLFDVDGYRLSSPYIFSYTPEPQFRVYNGSPTSYDFPDGINPGSVGPINLDLNSTIDTTFFSKIQISPAAAGYWILDAADGYSGDSTFAHFILSDTLLFDTKYTVSVAAGAKDANGLSTTAPFQFSFATQPFEVLSSYYNLSSVPGGFAVVNIISFTFNGFIDTSSVRSAISISPSLSFNLSFPADNGGFQEVDVLPNVNQMQRKTTYTVTINSSVRCIRGAYLKNPYSYSVVTGM